MPLKSVPEPLHNSCLPLLVTSTVTSAKGITMDVSVTSSSTSGLSTERGAVPYSGLLNALVAVVLFSLTAPLTKIALVSFSPELIATSRALVAGVCSLFFIIAFGWRFPSKAELVGLLIGGACVTLVFPYAISLALSSWSASDMGVVLAAIPLITALIAAFVFKERHPWVFWLSVVVGAGLLMHFALKSGQAEAHLVVFIMLAAAGVGYAFGGNAAKTLGGWKTICWMTVLYSPVSALGFGYFAGADAENIEISFSSRALYALLYLMFISQWLGFHFWYDAMAKVGIAKAGQVQLLQPFFTLLFAVPLLGVDFEFNQFVYAGLISITVIFAIKSKQV